MTQRRDTKGQFAAGGVGALAAGGAVRQGLGAKANMAESRSQAKEADTYHKLGDAYRNFSESAAEDPDPKVRRRSSFYEGTSMNYTGSGDYHARWANYHARGARKNKLAAGALGITALGAGAEAVRRRNTVKKSAMPPTKSRRERVIDTLASAKITPDQSKKAAVGGQIGGSVGALSGTALGATIGAASGLVARGRGRRAVTAAEVAGKGAGKARRALKALKTPGERAQTGAFLGAGSGTALGGGTGAAAGLYSGRPNRKKQTVAKRKDAMERWFVENPYKDWRSTKNLDKVRFVEDYGGKFDNTSVVIGRGKINNLVTPKNGARAKIIRKAFDETKHRRDKGKFTVKSGMTEAPGSTKPRVSDETQTKLARAGLVGAQLADAAAIKSAWHESRTAVRGGPGLKSALKYGSKKAAFPVVAGGLGATLLADHVMRSQAKKLKAQNVAKSKVKAATTTYNTLSNAIYTGAALAVGSTLVGPDKHKNQAKLRHLARPMSKSLETPVYEDLIELAKAASPRYSQKKVDQQKKKAKQTIGVGAGLVAAGEAGGAAASRSAIKAKAHSELAHRVSSSGPNSPWLTSPMRSEARKISLKSGVKAASMKDLAHISRGSGRVYGGGALALGGVAAYNAHKNQKDRNSFGKSASSARAPRYDKRSGQRVRNAHINPTTNQARAQRWGSEGAGVVGATAGAVGAGFGAEHGLTHAANRYGKHVTQRFYQGKPVNLTNAEKVTRGLHSAAKSPKVAAAAALTGSAVAGTAAYNATRKTITGYQHRGTTRKKPIRKSMDVDELFILAREM